MKKIYALLVGFSVSISISSAAHLSPQILFTAYLFGAQEVLQLLQMEKELLRFISIAHVIPFVFV